jgi:hypothetical protein
MREVSEWLSIGSVMPLLIGDYRKVADQLETWVEEGGVDGFNIFAVYSPGCFDDFVDLVVPELQHRGAFRKDYDGSTLREHYFGAGNVRLSVDHPGSAYRRPSSG